MMAAPPNLSFEARTGLVDGRRRLNVARRPVETTSRRGVDIVGQNCNRGERLTQYRSQIYFTDGDRDVEIRVGPMMLAPNIQKAFDYYKEGVKFAMQRCNLPPYDTSLVNELEVVFTCGTIAARGVLGRQMAQMDALLHVSGNAFAVGLPDAALYEVEDANNVVRTGIKNTVALLDNNMRDIINQQLNNPEWNTVDTADNTPDAVINDIIQILAVNMSTLNRQTMMNCYVGMFLAYSQQGNITARKLDRMTHELAAMNIVITITSDQVRTLWNTFGPYFDDTAAKFFFPYWRRAFAGRCLRMELIMQQVANAGLTAMTLIRTALSTYPDFRWDMLAGLCPAEWNAFLEAHRSVGDDIYYGFKKDLGIVGVRNYKAIAYCAKALHQRVMGDQNMLALQTLTNLQVPETPTIDNMIQTFIRYRERARQDGDRNAVAAYYGDAVPGNFLAAQVPDAANPADHAALAQLLANIGIRPQDAQ